MSKVWPKRKCCIKYCNTAAGSGIPMHRFPKEEEILLKWLEVSDVRVVSEQTLICGLHFKTCDYININAATRRLKKNAYPTLFLEELNVEESHEHFNNHSDSEVTDSAEEVAESDCDGATFNDENSQFEEESITVVQKLLNLTEAEELVLPIVEKLNNTENSRGLFVDQEVQTDGAQSIRDECSQTERKMQYLMGLLKSDNDLRAFTGINFKILQSLVKCANLLQNKLSASKSVITTEEKIVLTLCKLKLCLSFQCLGVLFGVSNVTANSYFIDTVDLLSTILEEAIYFPDAEEIQENLPTCFKKFKDTRIVLDCTEVAVENSSCLQCRIKMYSHYKGRQTLKFLIGITPSGLISFCSKAYGGKASDKAIFLQSGLLEKLTPGKDAIMTDKGFLIENECKEKMIRLYRPPFAQQNEQMTTEDSLKTRDIAAARVHVERIMERLKNFSFLQTTIPWKMTKYIDKIMVIICGLVNLSAPILSDVRFGCD